MTSIPTWCAPPAELLGRQAVVDAALARLWEGPVTLIGKAGMGATSTAGAVLAALVDANAVSRVAAVPVDGSTRRPDLVLAIGLGLGAPLPGDEASVRDALSQSPPVAVLLDDADLAADAVRSVIQLGPTARWILTGRRFVEGQAVSVPPLPDEAIAELCPSGREAAHCAGSPLLAGLPESVDVHGNWAEQMLAARPGLRSVFDLPFGLPGAAADAEGLVRHIDGRRVPRRAAREALGLPNQAPTTALQDRVVAEAPTLHRLACDLEGVADPFELRLLRAAARTVDDPALRALAAAAAARTHIRSFQAREALDLVRDALASGLRPGRLGRGLLRWLEGDALLSQGSHDLAQQAHQAAAVDLQLPAASSALVALARRCADEWAARGEAKAARRWLVVARTELAETPDPRALADTLRISGNLAAMAGEFVGAAALYDEALATISSDQGATRERAFVLLGQVAVANARHDFDEADAKLVEAAEQAVGHGLAEAVVAWRTAEVGLRRGRTDTARDALARARDGFRRAGALRGLLLCARLDGDLAALAGDREGAIEAWDYAQSLCVRTRNLAGLHRVLRRRLVVEQEGLPGPHISEIQEHLDRVEVLLDAS